MSISTLAAGIVIVGITTLLSLLDKETEAERKEFEK